MPTEGIAGKVKHLHVKKGTPFPTTFSTSLSNRAGFVYCTDTPAFRMIPS
jgi:hypothetical protein